MCAGSFPGQRYASVGMRTRVKSIANERPKSIAKASGPHSAETYVSGIMPMTVVRVVRTIGRRRETALAQIKSAYKIIFRQGLRLEEALHKLDEMTDRTSEVQTLIDFVRDNGSFGVRLVNAGEAYRELLRRLRRAPEPLTRRRRD